jgi:two-component system sensor histidine kinase KdpD
MKIRIPIVWWRVCLTAIVPAAVSAVCDAVFGVNVTTAGFVLLVAVLLIAASWGLVESVLASLVAAFCFGYFFLPPVRHLAIADPENWIALAAFLATSLVASHLSERARRQTERARAHQAETVRLYEVSRSILFAGSLTDTCFRIAQEIARIFHCDAVTLYEAQSGQFFYGGHRRLEEVAEALKVAIDGGAAHVSPEAEIRIARIRRADLDLGALGVAGACISEDAMQAVLRLVAIALEGSRAQVAATHAEAARQNEEFKSTLLDAIAHEFKTPLASLRIASSAIHQAGGLPATVRELACVVDEEANRLNALLTDAIRMAQTDASCIHLETRSVVVGEFLDRVVDQVRPRLDGRPLRLRLDADLPPVAADPDLASMALRQVIDNSLKYSPAGSPVDITAQRTNAHVVIRVRDTGPGIAPGERESIFQRFYRHRDGSAGVNGSGLGLYIAREIARTHGGNLWVEPASGPGSEFCLTLPAFKVAV